MRISTKKGDTGHTSLLRGGRVPKYHLVVEVGGILDEANSLLGLARAASPEMKVKRILVQVQKHLFIIGAEFSVPKGGGKPPKQTISESDINWLERLVEEFEEALSLPPGFVAFGQNEASSHMDVARTGIRKLERISVKMKDEGLIENLHILKYLNRLSDLLFLLAAFEEKDSEERRKIKEAFFTHRLFGRPFRTFQIVIVFTIGVLIILSILILLFHRTSQDFSHQQLMAPINKEAAAPRGESFASEHLGKQQLIQGGAFTIPDSVDGNNEQLVQIAPFYMDEFRVTNQQFVEFLNHNLERITVESGVVKGGGGTWFLLGEARAGYEPIVYRNNEFHVGDPAYASSPVLRVTGYGASAFATFFGRRLPTGLEMLYAMVKGAGSSKANAEPSIDSITQPQGGMMHMMEDSKNEHGPMENRHEASTDRNSDGINKNDLNTLDYFLSAALGTTGLNHEIGEWVYTIQAISSEEPSKTNHFAVIGGLEGEPDDQSSLPTVVERYPWEGFEEIGFRTVKSAKGESSHDK